VLRGLPGLRGPEVELPGAFGPEPDREVPAYVDAEIRSPVTGDADCPWWR
jgi:hypothetical protein